MQRIFSIHGMGYKSKSSEERNISLNAESIATNFSIRLNTLTECINIGVIRIIEHCLRCPANQWIMPCIDTETIFFNLFALRPLLKVKWRTKVKTGKSNWKMLISFGVWNTKNVQLVAVVLMWPHTSTFTSSCVVIFTVPWRIEL